MNRLLIFSVFIIASCGIAYELITAALASYILGDSIFQFSSIIGCYLFAMGTGSYLSKYVKDHHALDVFVEIELLVGLIGGLSALTLFLLFGWAHAPFRTILYSLVFATGVLVGMEIPLVMRVLHAKKTAFADLVSRVLSFDSLGALAVSLLFPLVLAPYLGLARSALLFGLLNVGVACLTLWVCRLEVQNPRRKMARALVVLIILVFAAAYADKLTRWSEQRYYGDPIIGSITSPYQHLVITRWQDDLRLHINGNLQFSSRDEHRYHEALVHPILSKLPHAKSVLILGGGDGLAAREVLKYPHIQQITLVDLDPAMTNLFSHNPFLTRLNQGSLTHPKMRVINQDAAQWLKSHRQVFDAIIVDFPDPSNFSIGKLYSVPMYNMMKAHLSPTGLMVVQSTSPYHAPKSFWSINATLQTAGFYTTPYHTLVPSFGEWGFIVASPWQGYTPPQQFTVPLRYLDAPTTALMFNFPKDMPPYPSKANHLNTQQLVHYFEEDWRNVIR